MKAIRKNVITILEALDIFSYPLSFLFTFKGKFRYSTVSTKVTTLFIIAFTFASFFYFAQNYIYKTNPQSLLNEEYIVDQGEVYINANSFLFTFALENITNNYRPFVDETIYKVSAFIETRINETITLTPINVIPCDDSHIPNNNQDLKDYFIQNHYQDMYCFQNYSEVFMKGTWDSQIFNDIKILLRPCNNQTDSNICQSSDVISEMIDGGYLVMHYTSFQTDLNNYEEPLKIYAVDYFQQTSLKLTTELYMFFGKVMVQTGIGVFVEDFIYNEGINLVSNQFSLYQNYNETGNFLKIYLRLDPTVKITTRNYDNLLDVLSKVGGLIRVLTLLGAVLLKPFLEAAMLQRVSNETFDYDEYLNSMDPEKHHDTIKSRKVKLSLWEYLKSKVKRNSELSLKSKILIQSVKIMKKNLDISLLINKLFDIEKLKLLNKDNEFEFLNDKKPKIILDEKKFRKLAFKTEMEKDFQKKFCIGTDSQIFHQQLSVPAPNENNKAILPEALMNETKKKDEKQKPEFLIEVAQIVCEKIENERFNDLDSKISEESREKDINCFKISESLNHKNLNGDI